MTEKIEVGYRNLGSVAGVDYHHKYLLYTDSAGQQHTISGWTGTPAEGLPYGKMHVEANLPYNVTNPDHPDNLNTRASDGTSQRQYRELIAEGADLSGKWNEMVRDAASKDDRFPYGPLRQNSNTFADSVLHHAELAEPKMDGFGGHLAPASHLMLDEKLVPKDPSQQGVSTNLHDVVSAGRPVEADQQVADLRCLTDSPLFKQARVAMHKLDAQNGRTTDQRTDNAAAAIAVVAQAGGMTRIDLVEPHGDKLIAVQGTPGTAHSKVVDVPAVQALNTPMVQSAEAFAQTAEQQKQAQQQERQQQQLTPAVPALAH